MNILKNILVKRKIGIFVEQMLQEVSDELSLNAKRCEGEAALYGPKLDFMFKDAF